MNGQRMECVPGRGKAVRPLLSVGARLIAFAQNPAAKHLDMKRTKDIAKTPGPRSAVHIVSPDERAAALLMNSCPSFFELSEYKLLSTHQYLQPCF
jgi:hypothetical protein